MMKATVLIDAGPLAALTHARDQYHQWTRREADNLKPPFFTCEAVWSETWFLLRRHPLAQAKLLRLLEEGLIQIHFRSDGETANLTELLRRYANVPMSVADACLVRMSEMHDDGVVFTTDSDFNIYRRHGNQFTPVILPTRP